MLKLNMFALSLSVSGFPDGMRDISDIHADIQTCRHADCHCPSAFFPRLEIRRPPLAVERPGASAHPHEDPNRIYDKGKSFTIMESPLLWRKVLYYKGFNCSSRSWSHCAPTDRGLDLGPWTPIWGGPSRLLQTSQEALSLSVGVFPPAHAWHFRLAYMQTYRHTDIQKRKQANKQTNKHTLTPDWRLMGCKSFLIPKANPVPSIRVVLGRLHYPAIPGTGPIFPSHV